MRKSTILFLPVLAIMFASCSDENDSTADYAAKVKGTYDGYAVASCAYFDGMISTAQKVNVTAAAADKVAVSYVSDTWGSISVPAASVSETGGAYIVTGSGTSEMTHNGNTKTYECNLSGKIAGGEAEFTFSCPAVMGGMKIEFRQGNIPASIVLPATYSGYTKADCAYFQDMYADDQTINIIADTDESYTATLVSDKWGEFTVTNITATSVSGGFTLAGEGTAKMGMDGNVSEYACTFSGRVADNRGDAEFTFSCPAVMGGLTLTFRTGERADV